MSILQGILCHGVFDESFHNSPLACSKHFALFVGAFLVKRSRLLQWLVFLGVGKNFDYLSNRVLFFFSPDLLIKISNFSKTVHTIFVKFCRVILHPNGRLRAQRHQNRMTGM